MLESYLKLLPGTEVAMLFYSLFLLAISLIFLLKDKNENKFIHYAVSLHGAMISAYFLFSLVVLSLGWSGESWTVLAYLIPIIMFASIVLSLFKFTGNKWLHLLHLITLGLSPYLWLNSVLGYANDWF